MKKKLIAILLAATCALTAGLTGCSGNAATSGTDESKTSDAQSTGDSTAKSNVVAGFVYIGKINDGGYTQAHDAGRLAVEAMGVKTFYVEDVPETVADTKEAIQTLIDEGCNLIYTNSFGFMEGTDQMAKEHPDVKFAHCSGYMREDNMSTYFGKVYQARYLAGIVAGMKTQKNYIGYVAAKGIPEVIRGINAFTLGVQSVNPDAKVEVVFTDTWYDPTVEKQAALELLNKGVDIIEHAYNFYKINGDKFVNADEESRKSALVEYALPLNIDGLEKDLAKYRIVYDTWFRESSLHKSGAVKQIVDMLTEKGQTYEKDGAIWFKASDFGDDQDRVLVRANGIPTYFVPDIAYHYNKLVTRGFDKAIDILGADHHGYIARMKAALTALGVDASKLDIVIMQMVMLVRNGETVKLSKRSGKAITLSTLLDEVPIDAARFFFNLRDPNTHLEFDLELAIEESSNNPVFYVQYAHARICSILRRMEEEGTGYSNIPVSELNFNHPAELALIRHIAALPNCINEAAKDYNPSKITKYLCDLAQLFHKFYDNCKIKGEEENILQSRLSLCVATKTVFKNLLDLLKVDAPEKM